MQVSTRLTVLPRACAPLCLPGASLLRSASAPVVLHPEIILILDMTDYSRFLQMEGLQKAVLLSARIYAFHEEKCSAFNKGIVFFFLLQNLTVL